MTAAANSPTAARAVLVAPDKFKGTFTALQMADAICAAVEARGIPADRCPVADGGDGTLDVLLAQIPGVRQAANTRGPLGEDLTAEWALLEEGATALVEVAQSIGMAQTGGRPDAWAASSYGAGQLIATALNSGAKHVLVAIGGTATTDGGANALAALRDAGFDKRPRGVQLTLLCDVRTPWELAAATYAPQKGADPETTSKLQKRLESIAPTLAKDPRGVAATGAGGGLSGALWSQYGAELKAGGAYVLDALGFGARMLAARAVITGEGRLDHQTLHGKAVGEVATRCRQAGVPCHAIVGQNDLPAFEQRLLDIESVHEAPTIENFAGAVKKIARQLAPK